MKMFGAVVFLFLFILQDASPKTEVNDCPDGAFAVGESCYFFSSGNMNWFAAQEVKCTHYHYYRDTFLLPLNLFQYCWQNGGYLVQLESHREEYDLGAYLSETDVYWTGLNDQAMEGFPDI